MSERKLYRNVQEYFNKVSKHMDISDYVKNILSQPKNELIINFPVIRWVPIKGVCASLLS